MKTFLLSNSGRILALAFGVILAGSGTGRLLDGTAGIATSSLAVMVAVALSVVALVTAVREHFAGAVLTVILLPWLLFLGEVGFGLMPQSGAIPLVIAGLAAVAFAARRRAEPGEHPAEIGVSLREPVLEAALRP